MAPKVERLVNLTIALLEARRPMTFAEIRRRTGFYAQHDAESARRMFERDKDDLRRLGVPIEIRDLTFEDEPGYVVARADYELPDIDLDPDEVAALAVAVKLTGGEGTRLTLTKLAARAPDPDDGQPRPPVSIAVHADIVDPIAEAVVRRRTITFDYRTADGAIAERTVDPYAVVQRRGSWYLVGRDHDRHAMRTFRLDRVVGDPDTLGSAGAFSPPDDLDLAHAVAGPSTETVTAHLAVTGAARWSVETRGGTVTESPSADLGLDGDWLPARVDDIDPHRDIAWLLGLAPDVVVLEPGELREAFLDALARVADVHTDDTTGDIADGEAEAGQ